MNRRCRLPDRRLVVDIPVLGTGGGRQGEIAYRIGCIAHEDRDLRDRRAWQDSGGGRCGKRTWDSVTVSGRIGRGCCSVWGGKPAQCRNGSVVV